MPPTKKILIASDVTEPGGALLALVLLARHLPGDRFAVTVALPSAPALDPACDALEAAGVAVERLEHATGMDRHGVREFRALLASIAPALVHLHLPHSGSARTLLLAARSVKLPVVSTEHDPFPLVLPKKLAKRLTLAWTRMSIAISDWAREFLLQEYGLPLERTARVWNGIETARFRDGRTGTDELRGIRAHRLVLLTNAALHPRKGLAHLLEAMRTVRATDADAVLLVVGIGAQEAELRSLAARLGVDGAVRFLGWRDDMPDVYATCDVLVQPSLREAFGLAVVEAMAAGKPVVATEVGGHVDTVVDGETGLLVPAADPAALAAAVLRLAADPALRARLGAAGAARAEAEFSAERMASGTAAVYDALLA